MPSFSEPRIVCRPSLPADKEDVLEFTSRIWEGRDYIHLVWDEWLADPNGLLISAQFGLHVVGIAKLTPAYPGQWWLHGLRVDPDHQGLKIGSHLHDYLHNWWLKHGGGALRLLTGAQRVQVHRLCERTGFTRVGEVITYRNRLDIPPAGGMPDSSATDFTSVKADELRSALEFVQQNVPYLDGLMDTGWRFVLPDETVLRDFAGEAHLHWWRGRDGLLATWEGDDDDGPVLGIGFAAVREPSLLPDLLRQAVSLADRSAVGAIFWLAPKDPAVESALQLAGYTTDNDCGVLFSKPHPGK